MSAMSSVTPRPESDDHHSDDHRSDDADSVRIDILVEDGVAFLTVAGEVDLASAGRLRAAGEEALGSFVGTLRIDLAQVTFLDSSGIAALLAIRQRADAGHQVVVLENLQPQVRRILQLTGVDRSLSIVER